MAEVSIVKSAVPRFAFALVGAIAICALAMQWPTDVWTVRVFWTAVAAYCHFCWTSCFHETVHHTLCGSRRFSIWIGRFIGTMIFVPYTVYRESHIRHHAYLNKPTDWELWPYSDPTVGLWYRRIFCWLEIPLGAFTSPYAYGRLFLHKDSPLTNTKLRATIRREYFGMVIVWSAIVAAMAWWSVWDIFIRAWVIPHLIAGVFQTFRKFTEHLGMKSYDPLLGARTVIGNGLFTRCCTYLNFDIFVHGPHHRHPRFRHDQLCDKMQEYQSQNSELRSPVFQTYWDAMCHMIPSAIRNPGVGMNVGAPAPATEKAHQLEDFATDVTYEILAPDDAASEHLSDERTPSS